MRKGEPNTSLGLTIRLSNYLSESDGPDLPHATCIRRLGSLPSGTTLNKLLKAHCSSWRWLRCRGLGEICARLNCLNKKGQTAAHVQITERKASIARFRFFPPFARVGFTLLSFLLNTLK